MTDTLIRWRLREVMARYSVKSVDLAKEMGISANSIVNLRKGNDMPRLDGDALNKLCNALNKLAKDLDEEITPATLIVYVRDIDPQDQPPTPSEEEVHKAKTRQTTARAISNKKDLRLEVIPEVA